MADCEAELVFMDSLRMNGPTVLIQMCTTILHYTYRMSSVERKMLDVGCGMSNVECRVSSIGSRVSKILNRKRATPKMFNRKRAHQK